LAIGRDGSRDPSQPGPVLRVGEAPVKACDRPLNNMTCFGGQKPGSARADRAV